MISPEDLTQGVVDNISYDFLSLPFFEAQSLIHLLIRFSLNVLICWLIIQRFYYRKGGRRDFYLTFLLFAVTVFLLIFLLENVKLQMGFALGLFAIFGMIRYRTETVPIREMTYLFVIIGISVINGLAMTASYSELIVTNGLFVIFIWILESSRVLKRTSNKVILYDKIDLIVPERQDELIRDLKARTGLNVLKIDIGNIDFLRDVAYIRVYFTPTEDAAPASVSKSELRPPEF
ncbi:MAG: DUF4956 domain-containing protein [Bacteroidales bacterium]|nr:DUF4956 domain-containing protein [Bacteroidales bacterium]MDD4770432.1 DUF4956 domain-containing protein [Bacteroidales bacterium]